MLYFFGLNWFWGARQKFLNKVSSLKVTWFTVWDIQNIKRHNSRVNPQTPTRVRVEGSGSWAGGLSPLSQIPAL